ncbi:hypothetical protein FNV43_RR05590 [Rhamnella rubrinervis]|uniref:F-box/kelch-repeat protein n=1 Tax=Rhamnella rubrinervis TaxID=2594499 RepID=A0A8K0HLV5_9ROSA|nr:hypothetical protein FNV43_RR05590 [Rhamnella rubrinervis]
MFGEEECVVLEDLVIKILILPAHNSLLRPDSSSAVGFGFDPQSKDYKVVQIHKNGQDMMEVGVYSLKTHSWRELSGFPGRFVYSNRAHAYDGVFSNGM